MYNYQLRIISSFSIARQSKHSPKNHFHVCLEVFYFCTIKCIKRIKSLFDIENKVSFNPFLCITNTMLKTKSYALMTVMHNLIFTYVMNTLTILQRTMFNPRLLNNILIPSALKQLYIRICNIDP